jgi:hypothetical protein
MSDYEMVMPFVTVTSKGGPHDDDSYVAGFEVGEIHGELRTVHNFCGALGSDKPSLTIAKTVHTANLEQLDLVAMAHGFTMRTVGDQPGEVASIFEEWTHVEFTR